MKLKLLGLVACTALLGASQVGAATLDGTTSAATGIGGLVMNRTTYDVTFTYNTYNSVYSSSRHSLVIQAARRTRRPLFPWP